ncbi:unnamed protein product [Rhodiola kirilowii]
MNAADNCCVKVAVHVRPLSSSERLQGCKDCVTVTPGKPQVQIGTHSFSYDHVYDSTGSPSSAILFNECVYPLVDGLFKGYNATVLAYGQTGSGKTYIMGTGFKDGFRNGLIPQVMNALFGKIATLKDQCECHLLVSFIEIHNDEVIDLLDTTSKPGLGNGTAARAVVPGKALIQIRESSDGVIRLAGSTEVSVYSLNEMEACLEQGRLNRATGSTNMNNQSSRSHAIFTITLKQLWKHRVIDNMDGSLNEEYLCAKWHLVDLAGSERVKRTGSDGLRFTEGVHINKGLLALGKVISALGDKKKRKGVYVPYRDSKLTRLLQDSLGGNSRTLMVACISPADINAEETLNTLKYANRTRNIQNKPVVNRGTISCEVLKLRQQLEVLQAELSARGERSQQKQVQDLKERIASLEAQNESLSQQLHVHRSRYAGVDYDPATFQDDARSEGLKRGFPDHDYIENQMSEITGEVDQEKKGWEHKHLQNCLDTELDELNTRIQQKEVPHHYEELYF